MTYLYITLSIGLCSYLIYGLYKDRKSYLKAKDNHYRTTALCNEINRRCERIEELILHVIELRMAGQVTDADLLREDIDRDEEKIKKLVAELDNLVCK